MTSNIEIIIRLVLAAILGSIVGFERERSDKAAGMRTHMLVGLGACLFMIVSTYGFTHLMTTGFPGMPKNVIVNLDPSRIASQIVSGIGFLGAGTILFKKESIQGLTTAAGMWAVAAVGMAIGGGLYIEAISATILVLLILAGIKPIGKLLKKHYQRFSLCIIENLQPNQIALIKDLIEKDKIVIKDLLINKLDDQDQEKLIIHLEECNKDKMILLTEKIKNLPHIIEVSFREH